MCRAFECPDGLVRRAGSLSAGSLSAKMRLEGVQAGPLSTDRFLKGAANLPAGPVGAKMGL